MIEHNRNLELKIACPPEALETIRARLQALVCAPVQRLHQVDTYFAVTRGRLKLREVREPGDPVRIERAELIAYARPMEDGSRWSSYQVAPVAAHAVPNLLAGMLMTHDQLARVDKRREVAIIGATRVHLDLVAGLGTFVELETVIAGQSDAGAEAEHRQVIAALGLDRYPAVAGSYSDLAPASPE